MKEFPMTEIETLIKMANQIAANFSFHDDSVERVSDHLNRFWAPSMLEMLIEYSRANGEGLAPEVSAALKRLVAA
jgi:hypothetical protein